MTSLGMGTGLIVGQHAGSHLIDLVGGQVCYFIVAASRFVAGVVSLAFFVPSIQPRAASEQS